MTWARATLRRGASGGSVWQVDANYPQARVAVGSAPNAGWVVTGAGIALFHVELYWDGNTLYVADSQRVGDVRLDGRPVSDWVQVQGRGQLTFGEAILDLETSVAEATAMIRDPGTAPRVSLAGEATRVQAEGDLENERTRVAAPLEELPPSKAQISMRPPAPPGRASVPPPPPGRGAPPPRPPGLGVAPPAPPPPAGAERPRLGGAPAPAGRKEARTLVGGEELAPLGQEATRMVDSEALAPSGGAPAFGQPQGFGGQPQGFGGQPQGFGGQPQGFGGQPQGFGGQPQGFGGQPGAFGPQGFAGQPGAAGVQVDSSLQPQTAPGIQAPPALAPMGGAPMGPGGPPGTGGFVPPPAFTTGQKVDDGTQGAVPRRTRLLIMLFAAVVIAWLLMPTPEEEQAAEAAAHPPPTAVVLPDAGPPPTYHNPSTFTPVLTTELLDGGLSRTPESLAAQLVTEGHLEDALVQYEALAAAHPSDHPEYGVMVEVVRRRLMARCVNGQRWDGTACAQ